MIHFFHEYLFFLSLQTVPLTLMNKYIPLRFMFTNMSFPYGRFSDRMLTSPFSVDVTERPSSSKGTSRPDAYRPVFPERSGRMKGGLAGLKTEEKIKT